ncbi:uncharacterized protein DS421_13g418570 [Arachis hypogaea]|nr:uncharacterized protein DS421_13g418570 [Arachis hypogaea]
MASMGIANRGDLNRGRPQEKKRGMGNVMVNNERGVFGLQDVMKVLAEVLENRGFGKEVWE